MFSWVRIQGTCSKFLHVILLHCFGFLCRVDRGPSLFFLGSAFSSRRIRNPKSLRLLDLPSSIYRTPVLGVRPSPCWIQERFRWFRRKVISLFLSGFFFLKSIFVLFLFTPTDCQRFDLCYWICLLLDPESMSQLYVVFLFSDL